MDICPGVELLLTSPKVMSQKNFLSNRVTNETNLSYLFGRSHWLKSTLMTLLGHLEHEDSRFENQTSCRGSVKKGRDN